MYNDEYVDGVFVHDSLYMFRRVFPFLFGQYGRKAWILQPFGERMWDPSRTFRATTTGRRL